MVTPGFDAHRRVFARSGDVALAEPLDGEGALLEGVDDPFAPDPDPRPFPMPVHSHTATVLEAGQVAGDVNWLPVLHGPTYPCLSWMIGATLLPEFRGRGLGTVAQRLLVEYLFDTTDVDRIEAETDVDNHAELGALRKVGFVQEGVLRGAQLRGGVRRDLAVLAVLRLP